MAHPLSPSVSQAPSKPPRYPPHTSQTQDLAAKPQPPHIISRSRHKPFVPQAPCGALSLLLCNLRPAHTPQEKGRRKRVAVVRMEIQRMRSVMGFSCRIVCYLRESVVVES